MVVFLRPRRRPRCLLALAVLAWLMLALAPLGASPRMAATPTAHAHATHGSMHLDATGCCGDHAGQPGRHATHPCPCALPCAGVLPSTPAGLAAVPMLPSRYAPPRPIEAPLSGFAPPLRPPLA
ncbi:MAG TPA: hypothetical protein VFH59_08915 [Frateuria sp.]|uniref:hypothetical protein n=1 Tax=Frateuria sp. TaxID=2211372 RepID=UPI002D810858|nr:hypothetical protein [Frateuria sp.]HET6805546.1 hypothetical protein [Frateuria sp.]